MSTYVLPALEHPAMPVAGSDALFPVGRVFCLGRNYWWPDVPLAERVERETPFFFMKPASAVIEAIGELAYPPLTGEFCPEIELVIAIGKPGLRLSVEQALEHVWGYAAGLDLTRRDMQMAAKEQGRPWEGAKAFDGAAPISAIVPVATIGHPDAGALWLKVNGQPRQRSDLAHQIWSVAEVISHISHSVQLKAGDLIFTGTPAGVEAMLPGDTVTAGIDGIGELQVRVGSKH